MRMFSTVLHPIIEITLSASGMVPEVITVIGKRATIF